MNRSYTDDEETRNELEEARHSSIEEILHGEQENVNPNPAQFYNKEDELETTRDFIAVTERMMDHHLSQEEAEKKAIIQMREYYFDGGMDSMPPDYPEIDRWLKAQENKYQIGSCYEDDEQYKEDRWEEAYCHAIEHEYDDYETEISDRHFASHNHIEDALLSFYDYPITDGSIFDMLEE